MSDLYSEILQAKRKGSEIFKLLTENKNKNKKQPKIQFPVKLPFKKKREILFQRNKK